MTESAGRLKELIRANYWLCGEPTTEGYVYHEVLLRKGREAAQHRAHAGEYWLPFFSPTGYGYRFDSLADGHGVLRRQPGTPWRAGGRNPILKWCVSR